MNKKYLDISYSEKKRILEMHRKHSNLIIEQDDEMDLYARTMFDNPDYDSERQKVKLVPKTTTTTTTIPQDVVTIKDKPLDVEDPTLKSKELETIETNNEEPKIITDAKKYIGAPYVYGQQGPSSFDCSGFVRYMLAQHGIIKNVSDTSKIGRTADAIYKSSNVKKKKLSDLKAGDLVFFGGSKKSHIGLVSKVDENDKGEKIFHMIHASSSSGVQDTDNPKLYTRNGVNKTSEWVERGISYGEIV